MKKRFEQIFLGLSIGFGVLFAVVYFVSRLFPNLVFNYVYWTDVSELIILMGLFGLSSFMYLMIKFKGLWYKIIFTITACVGIYGLGLMFVFSSATIRTLENEDYTVYIMESGFLFSKSDMVAVKQNSFWSSKIGEYLLDESLSVQYRLDHHVLHVEIMNYRTDSIETYDIDLASYD